MFDETDKGYYLPLSKDESEEGFVARKPVATVVFHTHRHPSDRQPAPQHKQPHSAARRGLSAAMTSQAS